MFSCNHIVCDEEVLNIREGKEKEKSDQKKSMIRKAIVKYNKRKLEYQRVIDSKKEAINYGIVDYKSIIHFKKIKSDKAVPSSAIDLKRRYEDITDRKNPSLLAYLTDRGYYKDIESIEITDRLLQPVACEIVQTAAGEMVLVAESALNSLAEMEEV